VYNKLPNLYKHRFSAICAIKQRHNLPNRPNVFCNTRFHRGRYAQSLVNAAEIVMHVHVVERAPVREIFNLIKKSLADSEI